MKKIFSTLLITFMSLNIINISTVNATMYSTNTIVTTAEDKKTQDKNKFVKQVIISKSELNKTSKWKKYVKTIDWFIKKNENNKSKLEKLNSRLEKVINSNKIKDKTIINVISYMYAKVNLALLELQNEIIVDEVIIEEISESDKKMVEDKIVKLQLNLLEKSENIMENILEEFEDISAYEETWDLKIDFSMDIENAWKFDANIELNEYESITNGFDSSFKWNLKAAIEAVAWDEEMKLKLNSFIDLISKDWNIFVLIEDLEIIEEEWVEDIKEYLEILKDIAEENKYIKYEDEQTKKSIELLKSLNPSKIVKDWKVILSKPFFEAYKKDDEKYYIQPTKYACDKFKETLNKFDPFNGSSCSDAQYDDLIEELERSWKLYMTFNWNESKLWFEWITKSNYLDSNEWYITFTDKEIKEIYYIVEPNQNDYPGEKFELSYKSKKSLDLILTSNSADVNIIFNSKLDNNNRFEFIDFDINFENFELVFNLEDRNIDWNFELTTTELDYNTWERNEKNKISWTILWKTTYDNKIKTFEVNYNGKEIASDTEYLEWKFKVNWSKFEFANNYTDDTLISNIDIEWELDSDNIISDLNSKIIIKNKKGTLNYETWEYEYEDDFSDLFISKINIDNRDIDWTTKIFFGVNDSFEAEHKWNYTDEKFKLDNSFIYKSSYLYDYNWELEWNLNVDIDLSNNKNNIDFLFNILSWNKKLINFEIENNWKKYKRKREIKEPTNTIDYKEAFWIQDNYNDYYYDY